jgi:hypothetical protein
LCFHGSVHILDQKHSTRDRNHNCPCNQSKLRSILRSYRISRKLSHKLAQPGLSSSHQRKVLPPMFLILAPSSQKGICADSLLSQSYKQDSEVERRARLLDMAVQSETVRIQASRRLVYRWRGTYGNLVTLFSVEILWMGVVVGCKHIPENTHSRTR